MPEIKSLLTFVEQTAFDKNKAFTRAIYRCECGNSKELNMRKARELRTLSCGCLKAKMCHFKTHGLSKHPLYKVWKAIKKRCYNESDAAYCNYGALGIIMCDEWLCDPSVFINWGLLNGWEPGLEIDKDIIPARLGAKASIYSPETCMFVTAMENCNARRSNVWITHNGETKNIKQWSDFTGISSSLIRYRIGKLGWSIEKTLSQLPDIKHTGRPVKI